MVNETLKYYPSMDVMLVAVGYYKRFEVKNLSHSVDNVDFFRNLNFYSVDIY